MMFNGSGVQHSKPRDGERIVLTGAQMRAARALLRWRAQDRADKAGVGPATVQRAEKEDGPVQMIRSTEQAICRALQAAGVEFIPENGGGAGVRLRKP